MTDSRWERLFADLEAQLAAEEDLDLAAEIADRTRRERALVPWADRLSGQGKRPLTLEVAPGLRIVGTLLDHGGDWMLLDGGQGGEALVSLDAVLAVVGLTTRVGHAPTARRFRWGSALRVLARDRATVEVIDRAGQSRTGTIDAVLADALELAEHSVGEPRRAANVSAHAVVPFGALAVVRRR